MRERLAMLAIEEKLPTIANGSRWRAEDASWLRAGFRGLLRRTAITCPHLPWRRAGRVTDRGADTLRVRHNLKTAKALGLTFRNRPLSAPTR